MFGVVVSGVDVSASLVSGFVSGRSPLPNTSVSSLWPPGLPSHSTDVGGGIGVRSPPLAVDNDGVSREKEEPMDKAGVCTEAGDAADRSGARASGLHSACGSSLLGVIGLRTPLRPRVFLLFAACSSSLWLASGLASRSGVASALRFRVSAGSRSAFAVAAPSSDSYAWRAKYWLSASNENVREKERKATHRSVSGPFRVPSSTRGRAAIRDASLSQHVRNSARRWSRRSRSRAWNSGRVDAVWQTSTTS